jgi:hypothetical protein
MKYLLLISLIGISSLATTEGRKQNVCAPDYSEFSFKQKIIIPDKCQAGDILEIHPPIPDAQGIIDWSDARNLTVSSFCDLEKPIIFTPQEQGFKRGGSLELITSKSMAICTYIGYERKFIDGKSEE